MKKMVVAIFLLIGCSTPLDVLSEDEEFPPVTCVAQMWVEFFADGRMMIRKDRIVVRVSIIDIILSIEGMDDRRFTLPGNTISVMYNPTIDRRVYSAGNMGIEYYSKNRLMYIVVVDHEGRQKTAARLFNCKCV